MLKKILAAAVVLALAILVGYSAMDFSSGGEDGSPGDIGLEVRGSFPDPGLEVYTNNILKTTASDDYVYLLEHREGFILQFDHEGTFIRKISNAGRGPGELINPLDLVHSNGRLYTLEQGKMQIQAFTEEGVYEESFILHGAYDGLEIFNETFLLKNYYYRGMPDFVDMPGREDHPVFTAFLPGQDSTRPFGYYPDFFEDLGIATSPVMSDIYREELYAGYNAFPLIRVYNKKGQLDREIRLKGGGFEKVIPRYLEEVPGDYRNIFMDMQVNDKGIFLSAYGEDEKMRLYHFALSGELLADISLSDYYSSEYRDLYIRNFAMLPGYSENRARLFLTIQGEYPRTLIADMPL